MVFAQPSQDVWHGHDRQPQKLVDTLPRHRSKSRCLSDKQRPEKGAARKCDRCSAALHEGDPVRVFSRSADAWVDGEVAKLLDDCYVGVEYEVGKFWCGKKLHRHSEHLRFCSDVARESAEKSCLEEDQQVSEGLKARTHGDQDFVQTSSDDFRVASELPTQPPKPFQGCRKGLPPECEGDPSKYFIETDYIWELLEQKVVVLIRGSWLVERSRADPLEPLPCRQDLPCEAIVDLQELRDAEAWLLREQQNARNTRERMKNRKSIIAISHCWLNSDHPDPEGKLLTELGTVCEAYKKSLHWGRCDFSGAFFFAWCSLHQPFHVKGENGRYTRQKTSQCTAEQLKSWRSALENMDIWYAHKRTEVWMLTKFFECQGLPYNERGWTTWEHTVAGLLSDSNAVLDLGKLTHGGLNSSTVLEMQQICERCIAARKPPLLPEDFVEVIESKHFTCGPADKDLIKANYIRNFDHMISCVTSLDYNNLSWHLQEIREFCRVLPSCSVIRLLLLGYNCLGDPGAAELANALKHCSQLTELGLSGNQISDAGAIALADTLGLLGQLQGLNLNKNQIGDDGLKSLSEALCSCTQLQDLCLYDNQIGDDGASALAEALTHCRQLQFIALNANQIGDGRAIALPEALSHHDDLHQFSFAQNQISHKGAKALANTLLHCGQLHTVWLGQNPIGDDGAIALANALHHCGQLKDLDLWRVQIGNAGATALAKALANCDQLQKLDLSENQIGDQGAIALANALHHCGQIKVLVLWQVQIGNAGATALAKALANCDQLQRLDLSENQIGDQGAMVLAEALGHCEELRYLSIGQNEFGDAGATALNDALAHWVYLFMGDW